MGYKVLLLVFFFNLELQIWAQYIPAPEVLCGVIVDGDLQEDCLTCFDDAGSVAVNPDAVRSCVATYLPPVVASCAVPGQVRNKLDRVEIIHPLVHPNNTNANLLPNCLRRRMRDLNRYIERENLFTVQAGDIVKTVVLTKLIRNGGDNMLGIFSQKEILQLPSVSNLVNAYASSCLDDYENSRALPKVELKFFDMDSEEDETEEEEEDVKDDEEYDLEDLKVTLRSRPEDLWEDEDKPQRRAKPSSKGNGLPYGGTNDLSKEIILGDCIIDKLIEADKAIYLIQVLNHDDFYYPIPSWWVAKLLYYYKDFRTALQG